MDEVQEIKEYLNKLPALARQVILSADWHSRINEIGKKYSLGQEQINDLEYEILFVLLGIEADADFLGNIQKQLNISGLLANQIDQEVDARVFAYLLDLIAKKEALVETKPEFGEEIKKPIVPEIAPKILPATEKTGSIYVSTYKPASVVPDNLPGKIVSEEKNQNSTALKDEPKSQIVPEPINKPDNIIDNKLNNVVEGVTEESAQSQEKPVEKYAVDPYREPLN